MLDSDIGYLGTPGFPIHQLYVSSALAIILAGWNKLKGKALVDPNLKEDDITAYLSNEMKTAQREGISDILNWDLQVGTQSNIYNPLEVLKIDIKFRWDQYPNDNDRYLAAEAKKLRGRGASLAGSYVEEGIMRFVSAQYGKGHDHGIMIGYVVVPTVQKAVSKVNIAMDKRKAKTKECLQLNQSNHFCTYPCTYHSKHSQNGTNTQITLVHLFLDLS